MKPENIEAEVLLLPKEYQVVLLSRLLERLGQNDEIDEAAESIWIEEAELRNQAMDKDKFAGIDSRQVFERIRSSFQ